MRFKRYFLALMMVAFHALALTAGGGLDGEKCTDSFPQGFYAICFRPGWIC